ncbi:MAG: hypothetical protein ACPGDB_02830, partial [Fusobacterium sp.]
MSFLLDKFLEYVKIDTTSKEENINCPSTDGQFILATVIKRDLKELGFEDIKLDFHSYLTATLKKNTQKDIPTIGFIAQEVREEMPMAVSLEKSIIPNEMRELTTIGWEKITDT